MKRTIGGMLSEKHDSQRTKPLATQYRTLVWGTWNSVNSHHQSPNHEGIAEREKSKTRLNPNDK